MRKVSLTVAAFLLFLIACDEDETEIVTGPDNDSAAPAVYYSDVVHFDTSGYMAISVFDQRLLVLPRSWFCVRSEPYLYWEEHFGEEFLDLNGNGVYDPGIDIFDLLTMDLNRDGKFSGPGEGEWALGMAFDDIDGNGVCRTDTGPYESSYVSGTPLVDINGNGLRDTLTGSGYTIGRWVLHEQSEQSRTYRVGDVEADFSFTSDSGVFYAMSILFRWWGSTYSSFMEVTDSGLLFRPWPRYWDYQCSFLLLDTGEIRNGGERIPVVNIRDGEQLGTITRLVSTFSTLALRDTVYTDLVEIVVGLPDVIVADDLGQLDPWDEQTVWKFYFSEEQGLISADVGRQFDHTSSVRLDFSRRYEVMPIPLTR